MRERAIEIYKWVLYNVNGFTEEEINEIDYDSEYVIDQLLEILEDGKKYNEVK